nr:PREDICTED: LOW QUALITY PROTEIN: uncharacterized protein LOC100880451 [Megachile rotundata]
MFKRLSKSRRHSADDVALALSSPTTLDEPPGTSTSRDNCPGVNSAALLRVSRTKYSRRSCGDASAVQALLATKQEQEQDVAEADYQMVTAVPAFIVEHEPEKQRGSSFGVWGRRMSKKIDSFRRAGSRETICSISEKPDSVNNNNNCTASNNNISKADKSLPDLKLDAKAEKRIPGTFHRSPSPFKSFFIRMGSTGMLNSAKSNRRSQNIDDRLKTIEKENLFRSCSTSQLNTSPTYVKGDDPSEGIDLQIASRKDKTVSCDNLAGRQTDDMFDEHINDPTASLYPLGNPSMSSFSPCDFDQSRNESSMRKSSSCDFKEAKKSSFPYAFLRSKLSVLPEERHSTFASKDERLFKTASEEHFPTLKVEDTYTGTTTLGRRRARNGNMTRAGSSKCQEPSGSKSGRNSYAEFRRSSSRCEDRYSLNSSHLERIDDSFQQEDTGCYGSYDSSPMSLRGNSTQHDNTSQDRVDFTGRMNDSRFSETSSLNVDIDMVATLRNHRRNSAPSGEQRLSSHYVSSNESGYDSDGPRGESAAASENEGLSLKCTDSSDTSSVVDSELEKPIRSSTPSEDQENDTRTRKNSETDAVRAGNPELNDGLDGLRWHQSNSGRMLPSIHQTYDDVAMNSQFPVCGNSLSSHKSLDISPHRMRLQQDKSRFLSDIIQPPKRVRRCRLVQLHKRDPKESLGIRLAQQRLGELRYIVVQLESDGIAHRDGRLRLGDEIVEVEGKELKTLESLEEVQMTRAGSSKCQEPSGSKSGRNSYAEFRRSSSRCEDRYSLNSSHLERIDDSFQQEDTGCYGSYDSSPMSLRGNSTQHDNTSQDRVDFTGRMNDSRFSETSSLNVDIDMVATLRNHRRNSAPSGEQRLSSHYVSSNESGYDSDGPRGESAAASENEGLSLKCTDSSDTSSVVDSELEKPIRSSTPSEDQENDTRTRKNSETDAVRAGNPELNDGLDGLRWHQSNSGRMLPSIHQTYDDVAMNSQFPVCGNSLSSHKSLDISPHRMRLQQDKSRFLSDIIQPPKRVRRCRLVQLHKRDPKESLGIRLAQQRLGELRYIVVQLESDGIAHRDGRLRLGDEIVEVEGKELKTLESLEEVQDFLRSFTGNKIRLMTAYEETVPQVYVSPPTLPGEYEYLENAKNLSNLSLIDSESKQLEQSGNKVNDGVQSKRPDFLPLSCLSKERKGAESNLESTTEPQHYLTRHIAKFEKGYGKPSLGFSVVGGRDSPRGEMGIFVRRVFPGGQADVSKSLFQGDEIVSLNGKVLRGYTHQEVIELFKAVREGPVELEITRRHRYPKNQQKSAPC